MKKGAGPSGARAAAQQLHYSADPCCPATSVRLLVPGGPQDSLPSADRFRPAFPRAPAMTAGHETELKKLKARAPAGACSCVMGSALAGCLRSRPYSASIVTDSICTIDRAPPLTPRQLPPPAACRRPRRRPPAGLLLCAGGGAAG